jgi:hypothetical protein
MHLRSNGKYSGAFSACGNYHGVHLPWRSVKQVKCKNCLKIIEANVETKFFIPHKAKFVAAVDEARKK